MANDKKKMVEAITAQEVDFAQWYTDICTKAELVEYSSVKGFVVLRPYGYAIWENIQKNLDARFKATGHENVAMPVLIPESLLQKEKDHVEGFAPECAWVTVGGSEAIDLCIRAVIRPGDEVLIPEPSFVCYSPITRMTGGVAVPIVTRAEDDFRLTAAQLRAHITPKTRLLILPFPNNPTGAVMGREDLEEIAAVLRETDVMVLSDEIYAELTYGERHVSIASIDGMYERTVLVSGFSKAYAMTGWRLGYAVGHPDIISVMTKIHQFAIMCAPTTSQYAAIEAMQNGDEDIEAMKNEYNYRRRVILDGFRNMGLDCFEPRGAFYVFPSIQRTGMDSNTFCNRLLEDQKVAVVPGNAFGESGEGFIRCSYAYSIKKINEALERIESFVRKFI